MEKGVPRRKDSKCAELAAKEGEYIARVSSDGRTKEGEDSNRGYTCGLWQ